MVRLENLTKGFPERRSWAELATRPFARPRHTVLDRVSLEVAQGEFFGLLGPNGAGKTTLFKTLATLITPDGGTATVDGHDVVRHRAAVRRVLTPVIPDERSLYWRLTAGANLRLFASLYGARRDTAAARSRDLLATVGLGEVGTRLVGQFSSGMKQRLLIARALLSDPKVLLLDEPTRSLDPIAARDLRRFLKEEIAGRLGCTVLLATHNADEAFELCDRLAVLDRGRLLAVGTADALMQRVLDDSYLVLARATREMVAGAMPNGIPVVPSGSAGRNGWQEFRLRIPGGDEHAAEVLMALGRAGVAVSRFERVQLVLAELIERIVATAGDRHA